MSRIASLESARSGRPLAKHLSKSPGSVTPPLHRKAASSGAIRKGKAAVSHHHHSHSPLRTSSHPSFALSDLSDDDAAGNSDETASDYNPHSTSTSRRYHGLKLGVPKRSTIASSSTSSPYQTHTHAHSKMKGSNERRESGAVSSSTAASVRRKAEQRQKPERKATVRKDRYELEGGESDSDLSDVPSEEDEEAAARAGLSSTSTTRGGQASAVSGGGGGGGDASDSELDSASDPEMEAKLRAAGDGESLLGSAASDRDDENTADEEERYIIQRATRKAARRQTLSKSAAGGPPLGRGRNGTARNGASDQRRSVRSGEEGTGGEAADDMGEDEPGDRSTGGGGGRPRRSLSPETMRQLGLDDFEDELFAPQSAFGSASEPSFTDFFASDSDSDDDDALSAHDDDAELTSDGTDSDEMSDIVAAANAALLVGEPLIAQIGGDAAAAAAAPVALQPGQEIPLLVIEDLDGRLIYARAGDGEAVFGSDGEFEIIDESEDEMTSEDEDVEARSAPWGSWRARGAQGDDSAVATQPDEGETTDELADEEMPFPRLLVGSVAPRGGRNTRRARAMAAAKSRQRLGNSASLAPGAGGHRRSISDQSVSQLSDAGAGLTTASAVASDSGSAGVIGNVNPFEVDFTVSTEALARDPAGTIATAAQQLGITQAAAAELLAGVQVPSGVALAAESSSSQAGPSSQASSSMEPGVPATPVKEAPKPEMGSFMPTSAKSVHRAVIDGSKQAPSPFANRHGMQKRGLAHGLRKRQLSGRRDSSSTQSSKRPRRLSAGAAGAVSARDEASEAPSSPEAVRIDPMDIDDVVNASMLWRSSSFSASGGSGAEEDDTDEDVDMEIDEASTAGASATTETVPRMGRASSRASSTTAPSATGSATDAPGLNLNAFARWDRIPMGAFRDGQGSSSSTRQPLGTFLLTRSQRGHNGTARPGARGGGEHSPFRGNGRSSEGAGIHMGAAPRVPPPESPLANAGASEALDAAQARRRAAFFVSPILWPVRGDGERGQLAMAEVPPLQLGGPSAGAGGNGMMTKREKRERRARRASRRAAAATADALAAGDASEGGGRSPAPPTTPRLGEESSIESPASALPRLSITDASPRASPAPARSQPGPSNLGPSPTPSLVATSTSPNLSASDAQHPLPATSQAGLTPPFLAAGSAPSAVPSSACGLPLYSPLFGGIASPSNLGFHDDLDEHEANEGPLAI